MENLSERRTKHPRIVVQSIIDKYGSNLVFEFSHYLYKPQTMEDQRKLFIVDGHFLSNESYVDRMLKDVPEGMELSLNSRVYLPDGMVKQIPMIDLSAPAAGILGRVIDVLPGHVAESMLWFESGRSHHGYGRHLINHSEWIQLMGRLLLANQPKMPPIVDPRWIGHRLIAGYSALRWTRNTDYYIQEPVLSKKAHLIKSDRSKD